MIYKQLSLHCEIENTMESPTRVEELNLWKILKQLNAKLISYFKKLIENGYILFVNAEFVNNNKLFYLTYKETLIKKDDKELHITKIIIQSDGTNKTINFDHRTITAYDENGHRKAYVLDGYDRIINVLEYNNDPVLKLNFETDTYNTSYTYDTADNLVKINDTLGNVFTFTYDSLGRRISLSDPDLGNWTYTYDLVGNLITQKQQGGGNLVAGDGFYREYDGLNQLIKIRNGSSSTSPVLENYTYDPFGQRIKIMRNDSAKTIIYTPFKELMQIRNSSGIYNFTYIYQDDVLVARINPDGSKYYYHPDQLGSTSLITNSSGNVVENTYYSSYGELLGGGSVDVKLYTGQFKDNILCQYYYGARYFAPCWGIFIQPDSLIQKVYNPQSLNHYSYVLNNPYKYTDFSGLAVTAANEVDQIDIILSGNKLTLPVERTYIYEDGTKIGYIQSSEPAFYSVSSMTYSGRYTVGFTTKGGYDYTVALGSEITTSSSIYNPSTKFVTTGETKPLSQIIQQNQQKFWKTETYDRISQGVSIGLSIFSPIKYASETTNLIKLTGTMSKVVSIGTTISDIKTGTQIFSAINEGDWKKIGWELSGLVPGWGTCKELIDAFNYKSPGLNPFEKVNSYGGY